MINIVFKIIAILICLIGVILIFDGRTISEKYFSKNEKNTIVKILKITGYVIVLLGMLCIIFLK